MFIIQMQEKVSGEDNTYIDLSSIRLFANLQNTDGTRSHFLRPSYYPLLIYDIFFVFLIFFLCGSIIVELFEVVFFIVFII